MSKFEMLSDKAMSLVGQAGDSLRHALPNTAETWLKTGVSVGAARTGAKVAGSFLRRNPAIVAASAIGLGLVWVAARQYRKKQESGALAGRSRRIETSKGQSGKQTARYTTGTTSGSDSAGD